MVRMARKKSSTGIYHVMVRGINKEPIFRANKDRADYLNILARIKEIAPFIIHAYCLMENHVHLLLQENGEPIGSTLRRIGSSYSLLSDREFLTLAEELLGGVPLTSLAKMQADERDRILVQLKNVEGATVRQIARLTGLGRWTVSNA